MNKIKLTIELVPSTSWFSNLRSELKSSDWDKLKRMTANKAGNKCEICGGRGSKWPVECHEKWKYDKETKTQILKGLIALCPSCHEVKHIGFAQLNGNYERARNHLAKINGWTKEKADQYVEKCFRIWQQRSQYKWELNISWLDNLNIKIKPKRMK